MLEPTSNCHKSRENWTYSCCLITNNLAAFISPLREVRDLNSVKLTWLPPTELKCSWTNLYRSEYHFRSRGQIRDFSSFWMPHCISKLSEILLLSFVLTPFKYVSLLWDNKFQLKLKILGLTYTKEVFSPAKKNTNYIWTSAFTTVWVTTPKKCKYFKKLLFNIKDKSFPFMPATLRFR